MKKLLKYLRPYTKESIISPLFKLLEAIFDLLVPLVVKQIIDVGIPQGNTSYLLGRFGILVAFAIIGLTCALIAQYFAAKAAVGFSAGLRRDLFAHVQDFSYEQTDRVGTSTLITRMTADVNQLQSGVNMTLRLFLRSPIIVFGALIMAFTVDVKSAWIFVIVIPLLSAVVFGIMLGSIPLYRKAQKNLDRVTGHTRETLTGVRVIRAFRKEADEEARFSEANESHFRIQNLVGRINALMNPLTLVLVNMGTILLIRSGAIQVNVGNMTQGEVVAMTNYMAQILVELVKFANTIFLINKALACAKRVENVLDLPTGMETAEKESVADDDSAVTFQDVSLTYAGNADASLTDIDFSVPRGTTVGIIGSTGSGKTSIINLIPRFYDATAGEVRVFGKDVRAYSTEQLRNMIAIVPQKAVLFRGTIRSNLLWGNENATDEQLWEALDLAQAKDFVMKKEGGLDAPVTQNGRNFSGGQRQRLTIARALVCRAPILILDDSSSALDFATDAALRHAIQSLPYDPTVFIISQRTASIRHADSILVLEDGQAVGLGTHEELLASCEVYREIYDSQFREAGDGK